MYSNIHVLLFKFQTYFQLSSDESLDEERGSLRIVADSIVSGQAAEDAASAGTISEEDNEGRHF